MNIWVFKNSFCMIFLMLILSASCTTNTNKSKPMIIIQAEVDTKRKIIDKNYFKSGIISYIDYEMDSFDIAKNIKYTRVFYDFYENGSVKNKGFQGTYGGMGVAVGTWEEYNPQGELILKTHYHNDIFGKDYILREYIKKGKVIKTEKYYNDSQYETDRGRRYD